MFSLLEFTGGVDTVDKMLSCYSSKRKTNRWPMAVFSNIIDISALNAYIIFNEVCPNWQPKNVKSKRRNFLHELGVSLAKPYMANRNRMPRSESSASLLSSVSQESLPSSENSMAIRHARRDTSPSSSSRDTSPFPSFTPPPPKRAKSVPPQCEGRSRCHICMDDGQNKSNLHRIICCLCRKGCCKNQHNRNVCTKCIIERLI